MSSQHYAAHPCCAALSRRPDRKTARVRVATGDPHRPPRSFARRCLDIAGWLLPGATLALLPKCPACLAAYIALGTGVGLSLPEATYLRISLMVVSVASLSYLAARQLRRLAPAPPPVFPPNKYLGTSLLGPTRRLKMIAL